MKESKFISLLTRELSNELSSEDKALIQQYEGNPDFISERASYDRIWENSQSYKSDFDVDVDLSFDKFATKFNIPTSSTINQTSDVDMQSLFLKVAAAIIILSVVWFTVSLLNVNDSSVTNSESKVVSYDISDDVSISLAPGSSYTVGLENETVQQIILDGKSSFEFKDNTVGYEVVANNLLIAPIANQNSNNQIGKVSSIDRENGSVKTSVIENTANHVLNFEVESNSESNQTLVNVSNGSLNIKDTASGNSTELKANETLIYDNASNKWSIDKLKQSIVWEDNKLSFNNTPIVDVFNEIENYFGVKVEIEGSIPDQCHFTAQNIKNPTPKDIFATLHTSFNLGVKRTGLKSYKISNITCK